MFFQSCLRGFGIHHLSTYLSIYRYIYIYGELLCRYISNVIISHTSHITYRGCCWWPLSYIWGRVDIRRSTLGPRHKIGWRKDRDWRDWRKTCPFIQIAMWQLLYVWNALVLIAVPLGERERERGAVLMGCHDETREKRGWQREARREWEREWERCKWESKWVREEGIRDGENGKQRWSHLPGHLLQSSLSNQSSLSS